MSTSGASFWPAAPAEFLGGPAAIALAVVSSHDHPRGPAMTTWEYATVPLLPHNTKQILDNWGQDGWELVAVHTAEVGGTVTSSQPSCPQLSRICLVLCGRSGTVAYSHVVIDGPLGGRDSTRPPRLSQRALGKNFSRRGGRAVGAARTRGGHPRYRAARAPSTRSHGTASAPGSSGRSPWPRTRARAGPPCARGCSERRRAQTAVPCRPPGTASRSAGATSSRSRIEPRGPPRRRC